MSTTPTPTPAPVPAKPTASTPPLPAALAEVEVVLAGVSAAGAAWVSFGNLMHNAQVSADIGIALAGISALLIVVRNITGGTLAS